MYLKQLFGTKLAMFIVALFICATALTQTANAQTYPAAPTFAYGTYMNINNWVLQEQTGPTTWVTIAQVLNNAPHKGATRISPVAATINPGKTYRVGFSGLGWQSTSSSYYFYMGIWFDFDGNGSFTNSDYPSGERIRYSPPSTYYGVYANIGSSIPWSTFTVPSAIAFRTVRIRMVGCYSGITGYPVPTGSITNYGDAIDVAVYVAPPPQDAGVTAIVTPDTRFMQGTQDVTVRIRNFSAAELTSADIVWSVDGGSPQTYPWSGSMVKDSVADIVVGTYSFNQYKIYSIVARTNNPSGQSDANTSNDQTTKNIIPAPDAGISAFTQPSGAFPRGTQTIAVNLTNYGWYNLTSTDIVWTSGIGGDAITYNWTGDLASGESEEVVLGIVDFNEYRLYEFYASTDNPDLAEDENTSNDASAKVFAPALAPADYYIGNTGSSNTFATASDACDYISAAGIQGDGVLNIIFPDLELGDPNYTGPILLSPFPTSGMNSLVFKSESGDPSKVTVEFTPTSTVPYLLNFQGVNNVTIEGIKFVVNGTDGYGGIMNLQNGYNVTIQNNILSGVDGATKNNNFVSINMDNVYDVHITGNDFVNGAVAINEQSYCPRKINIHNNNFTDATWKFVQLYGIPDGNPCTENDVVVNENTFVGANYYAQYGLSSTNGTEILGNEFSGFYGSSSSDAVIYLENTDPTNFTAQTQINENAIYANLTDINAISASNVANLEITDNRIAVVDDSPSSFGTNTIILSNCGNSTTPVRILDNDITYSNSEDGNAVNISNSNVMILRNDIDLPGATTSNGYGITANLSSGYIANNQIGTVLGTGVSLNGCDLSFYYNTVATESTTRPAILINGGSNTIMRNIFQNEGSSHAIVATFAESNSLNQNNYFSAGAYMGQWGGINQATLLDWQLISMKDPQSSNVQISFIDFATFNLGLNTFTEELVFDDPLFFADPNIEAEVQGTDYNGAIRYSYFMGSENIIPEIFITTQPVDVMDCFGNTDHSLRVSAYVTRGVLARYEWFKDGVSLTYFYKDPVNDNWANKASLYLDSISFNPEPGLHYEIEGSYRCLVRGSGAEPQWTKHVLVNVLSPAEITRQPEDQRALMGGEVIFEVEAHIVADDGVDDPFFQPEIQWYRGSINNPVENDFASDGHYYGAKTNILTVRNITENEIGDDYFVVFRGACDSLYSESAGIKLFPTVTIVENPATQAICEGSPVTFKTTAVASDNDATIEYQWNKNGVAINGATNNTYTIDAVTADDVANYTCAVTVLPGGETKITSAGALTMKTAPAITVQPTNINGTVGNPFSVFVTATGDQPLTYQWYKDGVVITDATTETYSVTSASFADEGDYTCEVSNACGKVVSAVAIVTIVDGGIVSVGDTDHGGFILEDCLPNPVNDISTIRFFAPNPSAVRLAISDVYGKELSVLVDGHSSQSWNTVKVNASDLASGVYYYTLTAGNYSITRKLVVVK